ncbi:recombinase family protein [Clostridium autoethanogenum]|uniref:Recombinase family protein n=1 Tax=Clostridium autoethanogenum DSM 10061 TaxID=1341692 RepID=A0ABM5NYT4_9CLOT|nr:recombinase family protein [Clostridium autoethanogenum]AGY77753.1 recombinase family protein [Clostridium autoethanogenum DSM 10061]ALU37888.1 Resolvase domain-containing protein [Clostridium autoethanogenum DSM 10061]OVY49761.1 hypothetical protein WX72_03140 [Clostridium autoethanogenum]
MIRVSTNHDSQEESLEAQIEGLKKIVKNNLRWILFKAYTDKDSGGNVFRSGFQSMIFEQEKYLMENAHEPMIELERFEQVQEDMRLRSNIEILDGKVKRKGTHYSIKKEKKV